MTIMRRLFAALSLSALVSVAAVSPAHAADTAAANAAATWITTQVSSGKLSYGFGGANGDTGASADGLLALASATDPALQPTIDALLASVKAGAASYVSTGGASAAGKLAIVAAAYQLDPTSFGGVDLVAATKSAVAANGSVTPFASTFGSGLAVGRSSACSAPGAPRLPP